MRGASEKGSSVTRSRLPIATYPSAAADRKA